MMKPCKKFKIIDLKKFDEPCIFEMSAHRYRNFGKSYTNHKRYCNHENYIHFEINDVDRH